MTTITPALAREIANLLGHPPRREEADRRQAIIEALEAPPDPGDGAREVERRRQQWLAKGRP